MTSQLNVDTIVDKAGSGGTNVKVANTSTYVSDGGNVTQNTVQGLAKVGIYYDLTNNVNQQSWNVTSVTDHGTGNQQIFYTNNVTGNAISVYMASNGYHGNGEIFGSGSNSHYQRIRDSNGTLQDSTQTCSSVHGDLA
tara:strand:- start:95 stop:508 length:414 start_codon:yes stop_codon:yes gene_type:complete